MSAASLGLLLAGAFAVTYVWRGLGAALGARVNVESAQFRWIAAVAYAMLAGLIARMLVLPLNALADTPLADRLGATAVALLVFLLARQNTLLAVLTGAASLVFLTLVGRG